MPMRMASLSARMRWSLVAGKFPPGDRQLSLAAPAKHPVSGEMASFRVTSGRFFHRSSQIAAPSDPRRRRGKDALCHRDASSAQDGVAAARNPPVGIGGSADDAGPTPADTSAPRHKAACVRDGHRVPA